MDLLQTFQQNWVKKKFVAKEQRVLLAVSGGMDSMVLADLLLKSNIPFAMAHCNYQLRAAAADMDEALVTQWAKDNNIPFHATRFRTQDIATEWKKGIQETARILRYEWLDGLCKEHNYSKIVTAHHANDNVETLIINLFKGTGISGLHGIPETNGIIIRPLLFATRTDIVAYKDAHHIPFREDESNATDKYLRNAVRHHIIPAIEGLFPDAVAHAHATIKRLTAAEMLYDKAIAQERKKLMEQRGKDFYIPVLKLQKREPLETLCYELFTPYGFIPAQLPHIIQLLTTDSGHYISSATHRIIRDRDFLIITTLPTTKTDFITISSVPCVVDTLNGQFSFSIHKKPEKISKAPNCAYIDLSQITFPIYLRRWRQGDYFYPLGMGMKKKKLSKFFIDTKLPLHEKEHVWVIESHKRIVWVAGMRLDERFKVKDNTREVLCVNVK
jgi:tRNA(Ile)-lysidine synthase